MTIEQPCPYSCYPTVVSWLTGIPLDDILECLPSPEPFGFVHDQMSEYLITRGWALVQVATSVEYPDGSEAKLYHPFKEIPHVLLAVSPRIIICSESHVWGWKGGTHAFNPTGGKMVELPIPDPVKYHEVIVPC